MKGDVAKWERIRRLRAGELKRLFHYRWRSPVLPDDEAGRGDLWLLMLNASLATDEPELKMHNVIDLWAPWMAEWERKEYVKLVWGLDFYQRIQTGKKIGELLYLRNEERMALKLTQFKPIDVTDEQIAAQRRARRNERRRLQRGRTRGQYLAASLSHQRPWVVDGISRRTWERRRAKLSVASAGPTIRLKAESIPATASVVEIQKGIRGRGAVLRLSEATKAREAERTASSSSGLCHHLRQEEREQNASIFAILARECSETDPRLAWAMMAHFVAAATQQQAEAA
jgi:hypothetical protein